MAIQQPTNRHGTPRPFRAGRGTSLSRTTFPLFSVDAMTDASPPSYARDTCSPRAKYASSPSNISQSARDHRDEPAQCRPTSGYPRAASWVHQCTHGRAFDTDVCAPQHIAHRRPPMIWSSLSSSSSTSFRVQVEVRASGTHTPRWLVQLITPSHTSHICISEVN